MKSDAAFLNTIIDSPDDDGPRLVYADWLEERGEFDRAELIRLQCGAGDAGRARELVAAHGRSWAGAAGRFGYSFAFRRGFVEELTISGGVLIEQGEEIFAHTPVRLLRVIGAADVFDRIVRLPLLRRVSALHLTGCRLGDEGVALLARCPHLTGLRTLRLGHNAIGDDGVEALADSPWLRQLKALVLSGNLIGDGGAEALATGRAFHDLLELDLSDNGIGPAGTERLARCRCFPKLARLDVSNQFKGWSAGAPGFRPEPIRGRQLGALAV